MSPHRVLGLMLGMCMAISRAEAQQAESIPVDLARALIRWMPMQGPEPQIHVGEAAPSLPAELIPPAARVLGSLSGSNSSVLVLGIPASPDSAGNAYRAALLAQGWQDPAPTPARREGGFQTDPTGGRMITARALCRDSSLVIVFPVPAGSETHLRVDYRKNVSGPPCGQPQRDAGHPRLMEIVPLLPLPPGALATGGGTGGSWSERHSDILLRSDQSSAQLLEHYVGVLRQASWTVDLSAPGRGLHAAHVRFTDDERNQWVGFLAILDLTAPGVREVSLRLRRADSTPWNR